MEKLIMDDKTNNVQLVDSFVNSYKSFKAEISKVIIGQEVVIDQV